MQELQEHKANDGSSAYSQSDPWAISFYDPSFASPALTRRISAFLPFYGNPLILAEFGKNAQAIGKSKLQ